MSILAGLIFAVDGATLLKLYYTEVGRFDNARAAINVLAADLAHCNGKKGKPRNLALEHIAQQIKYHPFTDSLQDWPTARIHADAAERTAFQFWAEVSKCEAGR